ATGPLSRHSAERQSRAGISFEERCVDEVDLCARVECGEPLVLRLVWEGTERAADAFGVAPRPAEAGDEVPAPGVPDAIVWDGAGRPRCHAVLRRAEVADL